MNSNASTLKTHLELSIGGLRGPDLERWLISLLGRWGVRAEERADLIQETYCRWLTRVAARRSAVLGAAPAAERGYLARVARSALLDQERSRRAAKRACMRTIPIADVSESALTRRDEAPDAEQRLLRRERRSALLRSCAEEGTSRQKRRRDVMILRLAWLDGFSSREIARLSKGRLGSGGVDSVLTRVRRRLRRRGIVPPGRRAERRTVQHTDHRADSPRP